MQPRSATGPWPGALDLEPYPLRRRAAQRSEQPHDPVLSAMTPDPIPCDPDTTISQIVRTMTERKIDALPVVSAGRVVGRGRSGGMALILIALPRCPALEHRSRSRSRFSSSSSRRGPKRTATSTSRSGCAPNRKTRRPAALREQGARVAMSVWCRRRQCPLRFGCLRTSRAIAGGLVRVGGFGDGIRKLTVEC